jgi:hypothetical protein
MKVKGEIVNPVLIRLDFGCCQPKTIAPKGYLLNEIETQACNLFLGYSNYDVPTRFAQVLGQRSKQLYKLGWRRKYDSLPPSVLKHRKLY